MQLIYRGTNYNVDPACPRTPKAQSQVPYQLTYRGTSYTVDPNARRKAIASNQKGYTLSYRGLSYKVTFTEHGQKQYSRL